MSADIPGGGLSRSIIVYELPVRLWHWINAASMVAMMVTGYLIATPLPSVSGEASDWYVMGWVRFIHFVAGYVFAAGMLLRTYWAFAGNRFAREIYYIPFWNRRWTDEFGVQLRWMLFLRREPHKYAGHNPLAHLAMFSIFLLPSLFELVTGFAMYAEAGDKDALLFHMFSWVIALFPNTQDLHTTHHLGMWVLVAFIMIHVYVAVREDIMSRQSLVSTMIGGERMFKDDRWP